MNYKYNQPTNKLANQPTMNQPIKQPTNRQSNYKVN